MQVINWGLVKHPMNWLTVLLMVILGGMALHFANVHLAQCYAASGKS